MSKSLYIKLRYFKLELVVQMQSKHSLWEQTIKLFEKNYSSVTSKSEMFKLAVDTLEKLPHFHWTGIYLLNGDILELDYYIGKPTDHTEINVGQGVCGTAVAENRDIIIDDVLKIGNYLACSNETRSEIVVLIKKEDGTILGQIDVDSDEVGVFDEIDRSNMERIAQKISIFLENN